MKYRNGWSRSNPRTNWWAPTISARRRRVSKVIESSQCMLELYRFLAAIVRGMTPGSRKLSVPHPVPQVQQGRRHKTKGAATKRFIAKSGPTPASSARRLSSRPARWCGLGLVGPRCSRLGGHSCVAPAPRPAVQGPRFLACPWRRDAPPSPGPSQTLSDFARSPSTRPLRRTDRTRTQK